VGITIFVAQYGINKLNVLEEFFLQPRNVDSYCIIFNLIVAYSVFPHFV